MSKRSRIRKAHLPWVLSAFALLLTTVSAAAEASAEQVHRGPVDPKEAEVFADSFFERPDVKKLNVPGAAIVIVKDGKIILEKGYGLADIEKNIPVDPKSTVFRVGSISKAVTASAVMQLVENHQIELNKDINTYMGSIRTISRFSEPVTMEHLLTHSAGFDFTEPNLRDVSFDLSKSADLKDYVAKNMPTVVRKPGESYNYDNFASMLQGYIVQNVTGTPFHRYMDENIFAPLGMANSGFIMTPDIRSRLATGYDPHGKAYPPYTTIPTELPQGGLFSTADDMSKFMLAHLNSGTYDGKRILEEQTTKDMHRIHLSLNSKFPVMGYGFDMSGKSSFNGQTVIGKGGNIHGYSSRIWLLPEQNTGVFIAANAITNLRDVWFDAFMDHYFPAEAEQFAPWKPTRAELAKFAGLYSQLRTKTTLTQVTATPDGKLTVEDSVFGKHVLTQVDDLLFKDEDGKLLAFQANMDGSIGYLQYRYELSTSKKLEIPQPFSDVSEQSPYASSIEYLQLLGFLEGKSDGTWGAAKPITRGEFADLAVKSLFMLPSKEPVVFKDVKNHPAAAAVQTLYELGIVNGRPGAAFQQDRAITRQEAAAILSRMMQLQGVEPMDAKLAGATDAWAVDSVKLVVALGLYGPEAIQNASGAINYNSRQSMLRQEAAIMFAKALQL